jgi:hypothetical protein
VNGVSTWTAFYTDTMLCDPRANSATDIRDLTLLEPVTRAAVEAIVAGAAALGITLCVTETFRSKSRQAQLFARHATQLQEVGVHHFGLACDFCKIVDGKACWEGDWTFLGRLARANLLIWGGDWGNPGAAHGFKDMDHVQRVAVKDQPRLFAGEWYPDGDYTPWA